MMTFDISEGCVVNLRSFSEENIDIERYGYMNVSGDLIFHSTYSGPDWYRGVVIHALDPGTCVGYGSLHSFDTNPSTDESDFLVRFLKGTQNGTILLGVSLDDPYHSLQPALSFLLSAGIDVGDVGYQGMFAFVLQTGYPNKTVVEKAKTRARPILLSVEIRAGSNIYINGNQIPFIFSDSCVLMEFVP